MDRNERIEALRQVAADLNEVAGSGPDDTEHLAEVRAEIERLLKDAQARPDASMVEKMTQLVHRLEDQHPKTAYAISQAAEILGRMGL